MSGLSKLEKPLALSASPLQEVTSQILIDKELSLFVKRDELLHPLVSGNKWRKLCYNLSAAIEQGKEVLVTFGGAYSNHIHAVAAAGKLLGFKTIGLVRGKEPLNWGATLEFAKNAGMDLHFLSRTSYRQKEIPAFINLEEVYLLPEGGTNELAILGCREIVDEVLMQLGESIPMYWCLSCGTGGTITGIIDRLSGQGQVLGFPALKGDFLHQEIISLQEKYKLQNQSNWNLMTEYHFGGYARYRKELLDFIKFFYEETKIPLDPIYTGKLCYGIYDLIAKDFFPKGARIIAIHTGGLQGNVGFNQRFGTQLPGAPIE